MPLEQSKPDSPDPRRALRAFLEWSWSRLHQCLNLPCCLSFVIPLLVWTKMTGYLQWMASVCFNQCVLLALSSLSTFRPLSFLLWLFLRRPCSASECVCVCVCVCPALENFLNVLLFACLLCLFVLPRAFFRVVVVRIPLESKNGGGSCLDSAPVFLILNVPVVIILITK